MKPGGHSCAIAVLPSCVSTGEFSPDAADTEAAQIAADYAEVLRSFPAKVVARCAGNAPVETIKEWRAGNVPGAFVRNLMAARRIPKLCAAVVELSGEASLLAPLIAELEAIASGPDEISSVRARAALTRFAAAVGG